MLSKATLFSVFTVLASANPLLVSRNTDPSGSYPVCATSKQPTGKPFYIAVVPYGTDPAYGAGYLQSFTDGQLLAGSNNGISPTTQNCQSDTQPFFFFAPNGLLYDNHGRQVQSSSAGQIQANYGGGSTTFSICSSDSTNDLTFNGINTFYACKNGNSGSYKVYSGTQVPASSNANCNVVNLAASYLS